MRSVVDGVGPCRFRARRAGTHYEALLRAIIYQQISGKAAATILARLATAFGGRLPTAEEMTSSSEARLRAAGLSRQKQRYLRDLSERTAAGAMAFDRIARLPDAEVIRTLTAVKGIGVWTAQMFLMFRLARPDVLPSADLGVQKAVQRAWQLRSRPEPRRVEAIGAAWAPHRTVAAWYLWRSLDGDAAI